MGLPVRWFAMLGAPVVWSACFLLLVVLAQWACSTSLAESRVAGIHLVNAAGLLLTLGAIGLVVYAGRIGYERWRAPRRERDDPEATREESDRFMAFFGLVISVIFGAGLVYQAIGLLLLPPCLF